MRTRERSREQRERPRGEGGPAEAGSGELRDMAERLLAAGDDAINRALSADSEAYLSATRQRGGE